MTHRTLEIVSATEPALVNPDASFDATDYSWTEWKTWAVVFALAMLFGFIEAGQLRLGSSVIGQGVPVSVALTLVMPYWLLAACALPLIAVVGRRFRLWQVLLRPNIAALAIAATVFPIFALGGRALLAAADAGAGDIRPTSVQLFQAYFPLDLITYTAFVGTLYAFHYFREARRREISASRLQASLVEARLGGLEARVDSDFLFNTLDNISTLAHQGQQKPVIEMLGRLSEVLRAALSGERPDEIPLRHEIKLFREYLRDSETRAPGTIDIDVNVPPELLDALVPRMVLPTITESALGRPELEWRTRRITIRTTCQDDALRTAIDIHHSADESHGWRSDDVELRGVREQLERLYGRSQSLDVSRKDGTSGAVLTIPFRLALAGEDRAGI